MSDMVGWAVDNCEVCFDAVKPLSEKGGPEEGTLKLVCPFGDAGDRFFNS